MSPEVVHQHPNSHVPAEAWCPWSHRSDVISVIQHSAPPTRAPAAHNVIGHRLPQGPDHRSVLCQGYSQSTDSSSPGLQKWTMVEK